MPFHSKETIYEPLGSDEARLFQSSDSIESQDDKTTLLHRFYKPSSHSASFARATGKSLAIINTILLISIIIILSLSRRENTPSSEFECAAKTSFYCKKTPLNDVDLMIIAPLLEEGSGAIEYENVRFQGALEHQSVYKGPPNKELDKAWSYIQHSASPLSKMKSQHQITYTISE